MVFEINPRFSTTNVVRTACGFNEVEILVDNFLTGEKKIIKKYKKKTAMAYLEYAIIDSQEIENYAIQGSTISKADINNWL